MIVDDQKSSRLILDSLRRSFIPLFPANVIHIYTNLYVANEIKSYPIIIRPIFVASGLQLGNINLTLVQPYKPSSNHFLLTRQENFFTCQFREILPHSNKTT